MADDILALVDKGIAQTAEVVAAVPDDTWRQATFCTEWSVRDVAGHVAAGAAVFAAAIAAQPTSFEDLSKDVLGADPKAGFQRTMDALRVAWASPGVLDRTIDLPFGPISGGTAAKFSFIDVLVHGLDIAAATGGEACIDDQLCAEALDVARSMGVDQLRMPGMYGPEVTVGDDARPHLRLLGYMGREV